MRGVKVKSAFIDGIGYDAKTRSVTIRFDNGSQYNYKNFPQSKYLKFLKTKSKGEFFHQHIKQRHPESRLK